MAAPATLVEQYVKTLNDNTISLDNKFEIACAIVAALGDGDRNKNIIENDQKLIMYAWFKVGKGLELKDTPSRLNVSERAKWDAHKKALKELTPDVCKVNYINFIKGVMESPKHKKDVLEIFQKATKATTEILKILQKVTKAGAETAAAGSNGAAAAANDSAAAKPVLLSAAGQAATPAMGAAGAAGGAAPANGTDYLPGEHPEKLTLT